MARIQDQYSREKSTDAWTSCKQGNIDDDHKGIGDEKNGSIYFTFLHTASMNNLFLTSNKN